MNYRLCAFADEADAMLTGQIAAMQRNGISLLEIRGVDGQNISVLSPAKVREVANLLSDNGLKVWSIGSPTGKITLRDDWKAHLDSFKGMLDAAAVFGAEAFRMFSFYDAQGEKNEVIDRLGTLCELAKGYRVKLCHENEKGIFGDTPQRTRELLDALPQLGGIFDPANFIQCGQDTLEGWELLHSYVNYMHIKDALPNGSVVPPGDGIGNVPLLLEKFAAQGGSLLSLEPHLSDFVGLKALEREGEASIVGTLSFESNEAAFDHAAKALKKIIDDHSLL